MKFGTTIHGNCVGCRQALTVLVQSGIVKPTRKLGIPPQPQTTVGEYIDGAVFGGEWPKGGLAAPQSGAD